MTTRNMQATGPYVGFVCLSGNNYTSDANSLVANVQQIDVENMIAMGCVPVPAGLAGTVGTGTTAGGPGGTSTVTGGSGGAKTDTGHAAGGVGAVGQVKAGDGGATASAGTDAGGAAGDAKLTPGAGGAASAGTGNGGKGGDTLLESGAGGASAGGTAGVEGTVKAKAALTRKMARSTITNAATLTVAQIRSAVLFQDASGGNVTMATPVGTVIAAEFPSLATGEALDLYVASNHATNTSTLSGATDVTLVGSGAVTALGGHFKIICTGAHAYDLVRVG